jgi:hypothetical protein
LASNNEATKELAKWLRAHHTKLIDRLVELLNSADTSIQLASAKLLIECTLDASQELNKTSSVNLFDTLFFGKVIEAVFLKEEWSSVFARDFVHIFNEHDDLRYYLFRALTCVSCSKSSENVFSLMACLPY